MFKNKFLPMATLLTVSLMGTIACNLAAPKTAEQTLSARTTTLQQNVVNDLSVSQINGNVRFFLTDAPLDEVDAVNITVTGFKIKKHIVATTSTDATTTTETADESTTGDASATADATTTSDEVDEADDDDDDSVWVTTEFETPRVIDLTKLTGGLADALGDLALEPGLYTEIRLLVSESVVVLKDGTTETLKIPSGHTSGLKIKFKGDGLTVMEGKQYALVLDFDLEKSLKRKGAGSDKGNHGESASGKHDDPDDSDESDDGDDGDDTNTDASVDASIDAGVTAGSDTSINVTGTTSTETTADADDSEGENHSVEGTMWILKPVIKVLLVCEVQAEGDQCAVIVVDEDSTES